MNFEEKGGHVKKQKSEKYVQSVEWHFGARMEVPVLGEKGVCGAVVVQTLSMQ